MAQPKAEVRSVLFKNFTDEEFVCSWDGVPYRFPAGREQYVEDWKADHFAKHLVDRVMHKKGMIITNKVERDVFLAQALPSEDSISTDEALDLKAREEVVEAKEEVKKKKSAKKVEAEEEFPELKNKK